MANTTNFGWETPDDTDLVKDGAAAIRTLGSAIDTSLVDLKGGTTGQVLAKASNTDMDFTWSAGGDITAVTAGTGISGGGTSGDVTITNSMATAIDAKGDLIVGTAADTFSRLAVGGTNGHTLQVDNSTATGVKWAATPSPSKNFSLVNTGGTALTGASTITVSGISDADQLFILVEYASTNGDYILRLRFNSDTGSNYSQFYQFIEPTSSYSASMFTSGAQTLDHFPLARASAAAASVSGGMFVSGGNSSGLKMITGIFAGSGNTTDFRQINQMGYWNNSATISSVSLYNTTGNFDNGTLWVYKSA